MRIRPHSTSASSESLHLKLPGRPLLALLTMSILWGYGWTALKLGLIDAPPFTFTALRMSLSAACLLLMLPLTGRSLLPRRIPELLGLAAVQTSLLFICSTWAVHEGSAGRVAFIVYTMPFFTLLFAWPLLGERVRGLQWLAIALAAAGLISIIQPWHRYGNMESNLLALGAGITWAVGAILVKQLQAREPMDLLSMTAWQMVFGSIPLIAIAWYLPEDPIVWSTRFITVLAFVSVVITAFGWMLWMYALNNLEAGTASLATLAAPPIAMISSAMIFDENPNVFEIAGMCLIGVALLVLSVHAIRGARLTAEITGSMRR
ncbi:MAG: drug/metabolite transporter (DMT)-like permease [Gammaproteobacteria bacterium]|jgi:drug/metabolite transporter (DMT)-like permease